MAQLAISQNHALTDALACIMHDGADLQDNQGVRGRECAEGEGGQRLADLSRLLAHANAVADSAAADRHVQRKRQHCVVMHLCGYCHVQELLA